MKTLHLNLHGKWFDMIKSGEKKEEYREMTEYWNTRLKNVKAKNIKTITFSNGYAKDRDQFIIELKRIAVGTGLKEWGAKENEVYFVLHLGDLL